MTAAMVASFQVPLTAAEQEVLDAAPSDMTFLLDEYEVEKRIQIAVVGQGYRSLATFAVMADDIAQMRQVLAADIINPAEAGITAQVAASARLAVSQLLAAWKVAQQRVSDDVRVGADARALRLPTLLPRTALISLRAKYEGVHGRVTDAIWPCAGLLEKRLEEAEEGSCTATPLTEVVCVELAEEEHVIIHEAGANVKVRKAAKAIALPRTTEELRNRMHTLAITFVVAGYKHSTRLWLKTATLQNWQRYVNYLLSDEVALFNLDQEGLSVQASWATVLSYDFAMRKKVCRSILYDKMDFETALDEAMRNLQVKERYFTTPTAMLSASRGKSIGSGGSAAQLDVQQAPVLSNRKRKAEAKAKAAAKRQTTVPPVPGLDAKGKGRGKGRGKGNRKTPDGRLICDFYNRPAGCTRTPCTFVHICNLCFGPHTAFSNMCAAAGA